MLARKSAGYVVGIWLARLPGWILVRAFLAVSLLGGLAHATPITGLEDQGLQNLATLSRPATPQNSAKAATTLASGNSVLLSHLDLSTEGLADPAAENCAFNSNCYQRLKVPEPQSLFLVGSGLLSMAGIIRRRLIR